MKNQLLIVITALILVTMFSACSITSQTTIKPKDSFVLGDNKHGSFRVALKNISEQEVEVYKAPIDGGTHSYQIVKPKKSVKVSVDRNTALVISNKSSDTVDVQLKVTGDTGLSMGYKN